MIEQGHSVHAGRVQMSGRTMYANFQFSHLATAVFEPGMGLSKMSVLEYNTLFITANAQIGAQQ